MMQTDIERWQNPDSLQASWDGRAEVVSQYISSGTCVMDMGCGKMALERFLPPNCQYIPADIVKRDERTIVGDLNKGEYPDKGAAQADIITLLGVIEYIIDLPKFFAWLRQSGKPVIVTYHPTNITGRLDRGSLGWLNHLSIAELLELFVSSGFEVANVEKLSEIQMLFKLSPNKTAALTPKRVAVLSYASVGNFGDRLGYHLLQSVLPPTAVVEHHFFHPWQTPDLSEVDLLVLGIGNSLFAPMLTNELQAALNQARHVVGIFGTQYRSKIDPDRLNAVIRRLDLWCARYEDDIKLFGRNAPNSMHFGDWLIDAFPMAQGHLDQTLVIGQEIWQDLPLDRTIQTIQKHKTVVSKRLHPLLCALTSAEMVQYEEQREGADNEPSGKFRSMLIDIFGRTYPENVGWKVDRQKVMQYKQMVGDNIALLRREIYRLLECSHLLPESGRGA